MGKSRSVGLLGAAVAVALGGSVAVPDIAHGQRAGLEEIVVTARKREETLLEVPVAATAFSFEQLESAGILTLEDLSSFTPGLDMRNQSGGITGTGRWLGGIHFRGMRPTRLSPSFQVGAAFVDGVFCLNCSGSLGFEDVERVEVIRGPQAAFFGRSTFGGAINLITREPGDEFSGSVISELAERGTYRLSGSLEGPLGIEGLSGRILLSSRQKGSQWTATDGGALGQERTDQLTLSLSYRPNDRLRTRLRASFQKDDDTQPATTVFSFNRVGNCPVGTPVEFLNTAGEPVTGQLGTRYHCGPIPFGIPITANTAWPEEPWPEALTISGPAGSAPFVAEMDPRAALVDNIWGFPNFNRAPSRNSIGMSREIQRYAALAEYDLTESVTVAGNLGFNRQDAYRIADLDYSDTNNLIYGAPVRFDDFTAELRANFDVSERLRVVGGVNYYRQKIEGSFSNGIAPTYGFAAADGSISFRQHPLQNVSDNDKIETLGIFGSVEFDLNDSWSIALEGRFQSDEVTRFGGRFVDGIVELDTVKNEKFLPRVILSYRPLDRTTIYASYARGVLPGDINDVIATLVPEDLEQALSLLGSIEQDVPPETLDSYELGIKQAVFDDRIQYSLTVFHMDWKNNKSVASVFLPVRRTTNFLVSGEAEIRGFEFEGTARVSDQLQVQATASLARSRYVDFKLPGNAPLLGQDTLTGFNARGNVMPLVPERSASLSVLWEDALVGSWTYHLRGDLLYTGKVYTNEINLNWVSAYSTTNLRAGVSRDLDGGAFDIELFVSNLFDKRGWASGAGAAALDTRPIPLPLAPGIDPPTTLLAQGAFMSPIDKRTVGLRFRYDF